jgi:ribosomal protein L16/L10AE
MGKGKGSIDYWMTRIRIGNPIVELNYWIPSSKSLDLLEISKKNELVINKKIVTNLSHLVVKSAFSLASSKLPIKTKLILN